MSLVLGRPGPKRSDQNTFASFGLFLISLELNLVVIFFVCWRGVWGGFVADGCLIRFALKGAFVIYFFDGGLKGAFYDVLVFIFFFGTRLSYTGLRF
ncbi:MAG: hypothetical protein VX642_12035 [Bdellovibrionota bacterium]|nr:hypothetical protein [Bdellovibrionota bacterium]